MREILEPRWGDKEIYCKLRKYGRDDLYLWDLQKQ